MSSRGQSATLTVALATLLLVACIACSEPPAPTATAVPTPAPTAAPGFNVGRAKAELAAARNLWAAKGASSYQIVFKSRAIPSIRLYVVDGVVEQTEYTIGGQPVEGDKMAHVLTVDGVFGKIEASVLGRPVWRMSASYDPNYGFPEAFSYSRNYPDREIEIIDDHFFIQLSEYQPASPASEP